MIVMSYLVVMSPWNTTLRCSYIEGPSHEVNGP